MQYGIKKREEKEAEERARQEELMGGPLGEAGLNRAKKTPEELAAEAAAADQDEFTSEYTSVCLLFTTRSPTDLGFPCVSPTHAELKNTIETQVNELKTNIEGKCSIQ